MKKAVIFDMDGVLNDSQPMYFLADQMTLEKFGHKVDNAFVQKYAGISNLPRFQKYKSDLDMAADPVVMSRHLSDVFDDMLDKHGPVAPEGVISLIKNLSQANIKMAVASSSPNGLIVKVLNMLAISQYFSVILSGEEVENGKPEPDVFVKSAEKLGIHPNDCIVIEDSAIGVIAAKKAKMFCIGFANKNSGNQDLSSADRVIHSFNEIKEELEWLESR